MRERLVQFFNVALTQLRARSPREQLLIGGAVLTALLMFLYSGVVKPLRANLVTEREDSERAESDLQKVVVLAPELQVLRARLGEVEQRIQPDNKTELLKLLEDLAKEADVKVESIQKKVGANNPQFPETRADVVLRGATLAQTVSYLYKIESAPLYLIVRSLSIRSRGDAAQLLDVTFSVSSFQRAS